MKEEIIENEQVEEKPKAKRTRKKKVEETKKPETVEVEETKKPKKDAESVSKAVSEPKLVGYRARVATALLNVREKPSKASKVMNPNDSLKGNTVIQIVQEVNGWGRITTPYDGYVMLEFVERIDD